MRESRLTERRFLTSGMTGLVAGAILFIWGVYVNSTAQLVFYEGNGWSSERFDVFGWPLTFLENRETFHNRMPIKHLLRVRYWAQVPSPDNQVYLGRALLDFMYWTSLSLLLKWT